MITTQQVEEITNQLCDLYYATITGKEVNEDLFRSLVSQLKQEGYSFEPLYSDAVVSMYEKQDKQLADLLFFTTGKDKTINFICARGMDMDGWVLSKMHTNIQLKIDRLNQLYRRIVTSRFVDEDIDTEQFKNLIKQLKSQGYRFRVSEVAFKDDCHFRTDSVDSWINFIKRGQPIDAYVLFS